MSKYCYRPAQIRPGMTGKDFLKIAHGGEEIGEHEYVDGKCKHCGGVLRVDMWDQECGTEGTVSDAVRRLTAQWGLPPDCR